MANDNPNSFPKPSPLPPKPDETPDTPPSFEPTPDVIPTQYGDIPLPTEEDIKRVQEQPISQTKTETSTTTSSTSNLSPATAPLSASKTPTSSLLTLILLIMAGVGISASIFLYSQSALLKKQLTDISKTLEQQKTVITPTPTPSIIEIPTPTPTPIITPTATPSSILTPTPISSSSGKIIPFGLAPQALKIGLNHEPNAQLLLIKVDNAENKENYLIKYFFRKDLTTKKYFYVTIDSKNESEIKTNSVYVNPDNNIPSLNDQVLGNKLGIDFPDAYKIAVDSCLKDQSIIDKCQDLQATAQFIQSGTTNIWQITLSTGQQKLVYQINSKTKEILYKPTN